MNYYEILQVDKNATKEVITRVYRLLIKESHPDVLPENERKKAEERIKKINEAYEILKDDIKRKEYDIKLNKYEENKKQEKYSNYNNQNTYNQNSENNNFLKYEQLLEKYTSYINTLQGVINNLIEAKKQGYPYESYQEDYEEYEISWFDRLKYKVKNTLIYFLKIVTITVITIIVLLSIPATRNIVLTITNFISGLFNLN